MNKQTIRIIALALAAGLSLSCLGADEPYLIVMTEGYRAELVATSNDAGFVSPDGILRMPDGTIYLADEGIGSIEVLDPAVGARKLFGSKAGIKEPEDLALDAEGNIYFTDDKAGGLWVIRGGMDLEVLAGPEKGLTATEGLTVTPWGTLLVGEGKAHKVFEVTRAGSVSVYLGEEYGIRKPESMAFDDRGRLYISDDEEGVIYVKDPTGRFSILLDAGDGLIAPESIACSGKDLYINDDKAGKVYRFRNKKDGLKTIAVFRGRLKNVQGINVSPAGHIFLTVQGWLPDKSYLVALLKE